MSQGRDHWGCSPLWAEMRVGVHLGPHSAYGARGPPRPDKGPTVPLHVIGQSAHPEECKHATPRGTDVSDSGAQGQPNLLTCATALRASQGQADLAKGEEAR